MIFCSTKKIKDHSLNDLRSVPACAPPGRRAGWRRRGGGRRSGRPRPRGPGTRGPTRGCTAPWPRPPAARRRRWTPPPSRNWPRAPRRCRGRCGAASRRPRSRPSCGRPRPGRWTPSPPPSGHSAPCNNGHGNKVVYEFDIQLNFIKTNGSVIMHISHM